MKKHIKFFNHIWSDWTWTHGKWWRSIGWHNGHILIQTRRERGQTIKAFCQAEGISKNTYYYWQKKLRQAACCALEKAQAGPPQSFTPEGWMRLTAPEPSSPEGGLTIEAGGCHVSVSGRTDMELLTKVCRALKSLC